MPQTQTGFQQHPNYSRINTLAQNIIQKAVAKQADFFIANNEYFQGVMIPDYPVDGTTDVTVSWAVAPSDRTSYSWKNFDPSTFSGTFKIPFQIAVNVWQSQLGWSWSIQFFVTYPGLGADEYGNIGTLWSYQHSEGPDATDPKYCDRWLVAPTN